MGMKEARFAVNVEASGGLRKKRFTPDNIGDLRYAPYALLNAVCYGTKNALKIVINFCFWYIECNLGGDEEFI